MNKEISFFMAPTDEQAFIDMLEMTNCQIDRRSDRHWFIHVGGFRIQLLRCQGNGNSITVGRVAIRTSVSGTETTEVASVFRMIESWIFDRYHNRLTCRNVAIDGSRTSIRKVWVGPEARSMVSYGIVSLCQSLNGKVVFELEE